MTIPIFTEQKTSQVSLHPQKFLCSEPGSVGVSVTPQLIV